MTEQTPTKFREGIARFIALSVIYSTLALGVLGVALALIHIWKAGPDEGIGEAKEILQFVFTALLPLWGTWIGTVLAFYFAKENFEAANKQVRELVGQVTTASEKLKSVKVTEVMMPFDKIKGENLGPNESPNDLAVEKLYRNLITNNIRRALIFKNRKVVYALHKSLLSDFLFRNQTLPFGPGSGTSSSAGAASPSNASSSSVAGAVTSNAGGGPPLTISDMQKDTDKDIQNAFANGAATIPKTAVLLDVKNLMDSFPGCQDVFVTETGKKDEEVLGWISNVDILNYSKV